MQYFLLVFSTPENIFISRKFMEGEVCAAEESHDLNQNPVKASLCTTSVTAYLKRSYVSRGHVHCSYAGLLYMFLHVSCIQCQLKNNKQ